MDSDVSDMYNASDSDQTGSLYDSVDSEEYFDFEETSSINEDENSSTSNIVYSPDEHLYLGDGETIESSNSVIFLDNTETTIPIIYLPDVVLFPGESLPVRMLSTSIIRMVRTLIQQHEGIFGILNNNQRKSKLIGTTVEVRSIHDDIRGQSIVGKGRHRFVLLESRRLDDSHGYIGLIRILKDFHSLSYPLEIDQYKHGLGYWLKSTYSLFEGNSLVQQIQNCLSQLKYFIKDHTNLNDLTNNIENESSYQRIFAHQDPTEFSYWVSSILPLNPSERQKLLDINCTIQRLRRILCILQDQQRAICCRRCSEKISDRLEIFSMSSKDNSVGAFVNGGGYIHQMLTLKTVDEGIVLSENVSPSTEDSWFEGYGWTIVYCGNCVAHLGWRFDAMKSNLHPSFFWGIRLASIK